MKGILGRKLGMTQVFTVEGKLIPVTVIEVEPNVVLQKKTKENDGYEAVQLGYEDVKASRAAKAAIGHCEKANTAPKHYIREFKADELYGLEVGAVWDLRVMVDPRTSDTLVPWLQQAATTAESKRIHRCLVRKVDSQQQIRI